MSLRASLGNGPFYRWEERFDLASEPNLVGKDVHATSGTMPLLWAGFFQVGDALPHRRSQSCRKSSSRACKGRIGKVSWLEVEEGTMAS
ncbi:MAG: hypothetical protein U0905_21215 [Pirellulales bacterium]